MAEAANERPSEADVDDFRSLDSFAEDRTSNASLASEGVLKGVSARGMCVRRGGGGVATHMRAMLFCEIGKIKAFVLFIIGPK